MRILKRLKGGVNLSDFYYSKNALMHKKDYKYISRKWENGHWVYEYPEPNKNVQRKSQKVASGNNLSNLIKVTKGSVYGKNDAYNALNKMKPTKTNTKAYSKNKNVNVASSIANVANKKVNEATQKAINSTLLKVKPTKVTTNAKAKTLDDKTKNNIKKASNAVSTVSGTVSNVVKDTKIKNKQSGNTTSSSDAAKRIVKKTSNAVGTVSGTASNAVKDSKIRNEQMKNRLKKMDKVASNKNELNNVANSIVDYNRTVQMLEKYETDYKMKQAVKKTKKKIKKAKKYIEDLFNKEKVVGPKVPNNKRLWS